MNKKKIYLALMLVALALAERLWLDLGPNVELVMTASVLAGVYLGRWWGVGVALASLMISDLVLGNSMIMMFTWSAFGLIGLASKLVTRKQGGGRILLGGTYGVLAAGFFYLYTNFGVWLIGGLYPHTIEGLLDSYVMGLPFLKIHALSSGLLVGGGLTGVEIVKIIIGHKKLPLIKNLKG